MNLAGVIAVFLGGGLGSLSRYSVSLLFKQLEIVNFPWATLTANVLATLILGISMMKLSIDKSQFLFLFWTVGFCGGFSTFSTFSFESLSLIRSGNWFMAIANISVSICLCLFVLWLVNKNLK